MAVADAQPNAGQLEIRLDGPGVTPDTVPISRLTKLLEGITALLKAAGGDPEDVHLVEVTTGSADYLASVSASNARINMDVIGHIATGSSDALPPDIRPSVAKVQEAIPDTAQLELTQRLGDVSATAYLTRSGLQPVEQPRAHGLTTVYGVVEGVLASAQPKGRIRIRGRNRLLHARVTREQAQELGQLILQSVKLDGLATWDALGWDLVDFQVHTITPFRALSLSEGLRMLAEISGDAWNDVDAVEYVRELRRD